MGIPSRNVPFSIDETKLHFYCCANVEEILVYQAFQSGFSDYILKMELSKEQFIQNFFGPEGNGMDSSFIALYDGQPVGVILGGVRIYEGVKTMRCGALAITPDYRGTGISKQLFDMHKEEALKQGCKQLFLEVIAGNDRAISFYKRLGYEKIYDLVYFRNEDLSELKKTKKDSHVDVQKIEFQEFKIGIQKWNYHINWQNDLEYIEKVPETAFFGAFDKGKLTGCLSVSQNGGIRFLMVEKGKRTKGIGRQLLLTACEELQLAKMASGFPNNCHLEGFFKRLGFQKDQLTQFEMYLLL